MRGTDWNELQLSEEPAAKLLEALEYTYVPAEVLDGEREGLKDVILAGRLERKLAERNPGLSEENIKKAVRALTTVGATNLLEANEQIHTYLTHSLTLDQDGQGRDVFFIDYDKPENNEFIYTRQFKIAGLKENIIPDIIVFVNGIPLVVIECKSPTIREPIDKALTQLFRYQEASDKFRDRGAPRLFEPTQILIATCGEQAKVGTILTPARHYSAWKEPAPFTLDELSRNYTMRLFGKPPTNQDILIAGVLKRESLLDLVRNFISFEVENGKTHKKLARYQQAIAVNRAFERIRAAKSPTKRGGVIWHTQGSGKSLTMLWLAVKLRRGREFDNPTLIVVTDRTDLDNQIIGTFNRCGFPNPVQAGGVRDLRELIMAGNGQTIMTTIQKFQELTDDREFPVLTDASNVFVMADEAHRTQEKNLAANMRQALPNACFIGFTGTPIDRHDKSTIRTFGSYIHTYTIEQAVRDGATVPIYYESRLPEVRVAGQNLDALFDRYFQDYSETEREEIKKRFATEEAIGKAPSRIEAICLDLIKHYEEFILPNGFKAQVVTTSREAAVAYKETLDRLNAPPSAVLISASHNDERHLTAHRKTKEQEQEIIKSFKNEPAAKLAMLVVCDKLLTGFDAPVEQVMYLDRPLKEHNLLQAIARVNRTAEKKTYGLIIDYWGISEQLQQALGVFNPEDIYQALTPKSDELPRLQVRHRSALRFFDGVNRNDLEACLKVLEPEDVRADFDLAFRNFSQSMDMVLPDPAALPYRADMLWLGKVRNAAKVRYRDTTLDLSACGAKVKQLIEEHIQTNGVVRLLEPVSIFSQKFNDYVESLSTPEARASEIEHAIRHEIHCRLDENPVFFQSLRQRLEELIAARRQARIDAAEALRHLQQMADEMRGLGKAAQALGLSESEYALHQLLQNGGGDGTSEVRERPELYSAGGGDLKQLTREVFATLEKLAVIDWVHKDDVQREMRRQIKGQLRNHGLPFEETEAMAAKIIDLARVRLRNGPAEADNA